MSIKLSAVCDDANDARFARREGIVRRLSYRFLIILALSVLSWAALAVIVLALLEAVCTIVRFVTQRRDAYEALGGLFGYL